MSITFLHLKAFTVNLLSHFASYGLLINNKIKTPQNYFSKVSTITYIGQHNNRNPKLNLDIKPRAMPKTVTENTLETNMTTYY